MELEHEIVIEAAPEHVWRRLTDLDEAHELVPFIESARLVSGSMEEGAEAHVTLHYMGMSVDADAIVSACVPHQTLELTSEIPEVRSTATIEWCLHEIAVDPEDASEGTRVVQTVKLKFGSTLARLAAGSLLGEFMSDHTAEDGLGRLKAAVEHDVADL